MNKYNNTEDTFLDYYSLCDIKPKSIQNVYPYNKLSKEKIDMLRKMIHNDSNISNTTQTTGGSVTNKIIFYY